MRIMEYRRYRRCPCCADMHIVDNIKGRLNGDLVFFCNQKCRKYYFSALVHGHGNIS